LRGGSGHPFTAAVLFSRGADLLDAGRLEEAGVCPDRALAIRAEALGPEHPDVATSLLGLALLDLREGRPDEALPLAERAVAIREGAFGRGGVGVAAALDVTARAREARGEWTGAAAIRRRSLDVNEASIRRDFAVLSSEQRLARLRSAKHFLDRWLELAPKVGRTGYEEVLRRKGFAARASAAESKLAAAGGAGSAALVDDAATRAQMERFHEARGRPGATVASALRDGRRRPRSGRARSGAIRSSGRPSPPGARHVEHALGSRLRKRGADRYDRSMTPRI
jgi:tetratricopeptide (TPR) repeat protein